MSCSATYGSLAVRAGAPRALRRRALLAAAVLPLLAATIGHEAAVEARPQRSAPAAAEIDELLAQWRVDDAERLANELARAPEGDHWRVLQARARVAFFKGSYDEALQLMTAAGKQRGGAEVEAARALIEATAEAVKSYVEHTSPNGHFKIWTAAGKDELLVGFTGETLEAIRAALEQDLGYAPSRPVRVEIYPNPEALAQVSPLTEEDIRRSGTVALCKYDRLMIVTPRALLRGYSWRDTLAHEYVHLVVTRISHNTVPIWLHEGLAKYFETRWRESSGSTPPLAPAEEHLLANALEQRKLIPWRRMHPSMAKLPSQEAAALAFAQVQTAVEYLAGSGGPATLRAVIAAIRRGRSSWEAIRAVSGQRREQFNDGWKKHLHARKLQTMPDLELQQRRFGAGQSDEERLLEVREKRARRFLRLADMLRARRLTRAAIIEYEKARKVLGPRDELVANALGRAYLEIASPTQALSALMPVLEYYPELPGPQVTMGIAHLRNGNAEAAARHLEVALRINPFDPEIHCGLASALKKADASRAELHRELCRKLQ